MKKSKVFLAALAVILAAGITVMPALAYFTAHDEADGKVAVNLGYQTEIDEEVDETHKVVTITNKGPESCYVRVKAYTTIGTLTYDGKGGWTEKDGYYYFNDIVPAGGKTEPSLTITVPVPKTGEEGDSFNVIVVYESVHAQYDENGALIDATEADWAPELIVEQKQEEVPVTPEGGE